LKLKDKDGKDSKMAGSLGNVLNVADALKHLTGDALRFFMLQTHYRSAIDLGIWDWRNPASSIPEGILAARRAYEAFPRFAERVQRITGQRFAALAAPTKADQTRTFRHPALGDFHQRFLEFLNDDFNTGGVTGVLFELVTKLNKNADDAKLEDPSTNNPPAKAEFLEGATLVKEIAYILGLTFEVQETSLGNGDQLVSGLMKLVLDLRDNLRTTAKGAAKDNPLKKPLFDQTDLIRSRLKELGVTLEDRPGGTTWRVG
jgi:cysteinyl-tRNA synthetase